MSCVQQPRGGRETRRPTGEVNLACYDGSRNQKTYRPSGERLERHIDVPYRSAMAPETQPGYYMPPPTSPGWHQERPLADSDTLPARWRNETRSAKEKTRDINQGQRTSRGANVQFQMAAARRQRTPADDDYDDEDEESGSSSGNSIGGPLMIVENGESKPDDRNRALSPSFQVVEHEGSGSDSEDGYVHVPHDSHCVGALEREELSGKV